MEAIDIHKNNLIKKILAVPNERILFELENLLNRFETQQEIVYTSTEQKKAINQGLADIKNGDFYAEEELDNIDLQLLNEK